MPRGIYDRSKMAKKVAKTAKEVDSIVTDRMKAKLKKNHLKAFPVEKVTFRTLPITQEEFSHTQENELEILKDHASLTRRVLADRVNTIILLLEQLRGSL